MPVAVAGMHRSGSSLIARLLNLCGLDLGPADQLMPPAPDNTEGFWECVPFFRVNEEILRELGGQWDRPPQPLPGWESERLLNPWRELAGGLPGTLGLKEPWGWKDPRNSLTLPFWNELWPDLRVVVCVRNPLEVANSLLQRDRFTFGKSLKLWHEYNQRILRCVPSETVIISHYDAYFSDPVAELTRVVEFLRLPADGQKIETACSAVATVLRHSQLGTNELAEAGTPAELQLLYERLRRDGGPVLARCPAVGSRFSAAYVRAARLALKSEGTNDAQRRRIRELEIQLWLSERKQDKLRALADHFIDLSAERTERVRILEERLNARRHRYADRVAGLILKATEPLRVRENQDIAAN
jgi:hypothetical protein